MLHNLIDHFGFLHASLYIELNQYEKAYQKVTLTMRDGNLRIT